MSSSFDYLDLCRLCLVKDRVTVPIFEAEGDVRQIFLKITACLPVKVSRDDKLPKKICDDCVYKVETFYQFWNTTANAEKQLLQWLCEVGGLEDKQGYEVLDSNVMKQEQGTDSRLDGNVMQVGGHQNNMDMGMMDNMSLITMSTGSEQQFTSVPMDASGTVQAVPGPSTQTHEVAQSQTGVSHIVEEEEESEEDENSDEGCDNEEGLPVKEETEEGQSDQTLEPTQFVSLPCDEAGPSGLQQQKMAEMSEMTMQQTADGDPKTGLKIRAYAKKLNSTCQWSEDNMAQAIEELLTRRMSLKLAARSYNLPVSTLYERYRNARERREPVVKKKSPVEKLPINDKELDAHLIYHIEDHHARGLTLGRADICRFAVQIAECIGVVKCQPASSRTASKKFYSGFVSRHKELINRVMLKETNRSERDKRKLKAFLQKYKEVVTDYGIKPSRIHACVVTKVEVVEIDRAKNISALLSIDAAGETRVPPLFIYPKDQRPFRRIPRQDVPTGSLFRANSTGELTGESLLAWLRLFVEKTRPSSASPVILLIDSRTYPKELAVAQYVCRHYIHLLGIPTSKVNPLNQDPAKIYRNAYSDVCHAWLLGEEPEEDLEADFTFATRAFRRAGLWPEMKGMIVTTSKEKSREEESDESVTPFLLVELPEHPETLTFDNDIEMLCSDSGIIVND